MTASLNGKKILDRLAVVLKVEQVAFEFQCSVPTLKRYICGLDPTFCFSVFYKAEVEKRIRQNPQCKTWSELGKKVGVSSRTARKYGLAIGYKVSEKPSLIGRTVGNWTVLSRHDSNRLNCECRCGNKAKVIYANLRKVTNGCVKCIGIGGSGKPVINSKGRRFISIQAAANSIPIKVQLLREVIGTDKLIGGATWNFDD
jgi:hypothetical protein